MDIDQIRDAVLAAAERGMRNKASRSDRKNPLYRPNPQYDAMVQVSAGCRDMMDRVGNLDPAFIIGGFVDDAQRERNLASIRECRDFLTTILETTND
jgi:hypothetical protein